MNGFPSPPQQNYHQRMPNPFFGAPQNMPQHMPPPNNSGGLLSRLLSHGGAPTGGVNLGGLLGNIQQGLKVAEAVTPMIQQYGPLIKNIPALISMYKEITSSNSADSTNDESSEESSNSDENSKQKKKKARKQPSEKKPIPASNKPKKQHQPSKRKVSNKKTKSSIKAHSSIPKLYI